MHLTQLHREMERGTPIVARVVRIGTRLEQHSDRSLLTLERCRMERCKPLPAFRLNIRTLLNQQFLRK